MTTSAEVARIDTGAGFSRRAAPVPSLCAADRHSLRAADRDPARAGGSAVPVPDPGQLHHRRTDAEHATWGLGNFEAVLQGRHIVSTTINSLVFAAASAALALVIGWVTAWIVERTNTPLKPLAYLTAIISLGTPYILYVTAWLLFFGKAGPVNHLYRTLTGYTDVLINIYSMFGMVLVEGFLWSPLAFLLVSATLRNANPELEEAARVHGAGVWQTIRRVTMRLSLPSIMALSMLVFIRAVEAFEVPALVGLPGRISVLTTDIYTNMVARAPPDIGGASALSVLMLLLVFVLLYVYGRLSRHAERFATITGKGFRPRPFDLGRLRYVAAGILDFQFRPAAAGADADAGVGVAAAVLPAGQRRGVQARQPQQLPHGAGFRPARADGQHLDGGGRDRDHRGGADIRRRLARGAARARRLDRRPAGDHPAGVSRPHPRHRGDAAVPARCRSRSTARSAF